MKTGFDVKTDALLSACAGRVRNVSLEVAGMQESIVTVLRLHYHLRRGCLVDQLQAMERSTRQRQAIHDVICAAHRPMLPYEVLEAAQDAVPGLGIATVYRNLKALVDEGAVRTVSLPAENQRFEPAGQPHHHHFQCKRCQRVFDVYACPGDLSRLAPAGFTVEDHDLTLYGHCKDCRALRRSALPGKALAPKLRAQSVRR